MTKPEAAKRPPRANVSSFVLRASFFIRDSDFVISLLVDLTMGKLPEPGQISKWKCLLVAVILARRDMDPVKGEQILAGLNWRYATKQFDPTRKISPEDWAALESALILSPSSYGLQPWRFVVITDQKMRERLFPSTWKQRQILDCSHYVVFTVNTKMTEEHIDRHIARTIDIRGGTAEALKRYRDVMVGDVVTGARAAQALDWAARQAYLALGTFMTSAALMGIDTCPMEGFEPDEYDEILHLTAQGFASVVCCAAGYRAAGDKHAGQKKVRFNRDDVIHIV